MNNTPSLKKFLFDLSYPYRWYFYGLFFIGVYSALHGAIQPYLLKVLLDSAVASINTPAFIKTCILPAVLLIAMGFGITFIWRFYNYLILKSLPRMKADIVKLSTEHLRSQSFEYFQNQLSGALSNRPTIDVFSTLI